MVTWELGGELGTTYFDRFRDHTPLPLLAGGWLGVLAGSCWDGLTGHTCARAGTRNNARLQKTINDKQQHVLINKTVCGPNKGRVMNGRSPLLGFWRNLVRFWAAEPAGRLNRP